MEGASEEVMEAPMESRRTIIDEVEVVRMGGTVEAGELIMFIVGAEDGEILKGCGCGGGVG